MMKQLKFFATEYQEKRLRAISKKRQIPMSRLVGFALDNELQKDVPFEFNCELPLNELEEYAYADEAGKLLDFMKTLRKGAGLDILVLMRHDIGIPDKETFLYAFKECLNKELIEPFKPKKQGLYDNNPEDYYHYRVKGLKKKLDREAKQYEKFLKLKKKFEKNKEA